MEINYIDDCSEEQVNNVIRVSRVTIAAFRNGKYLFIKRRNSSTLELPEAEKDQGEKPRDSVRRFLSEKMGVITSRLEFVTAYSLTEGADIEYGLLYCADIDEMGPFPHSEFVSVYYLDTPPEDKDKWSFPETQKPLLDKAVESRKQ